MIYGDTIIDTMVSMGAIKHTYKGAVNPASINLRLGNTFLFISSANEEICLGKDIKYTEVIVPDAPVGWISLEPGEFMLATTKEEVDVPITCSAFVQGRSSIGRAGLSVQNAGFVDPGFRGHITLELKNDSGVRMKIPVGYPVAQLIFIETHDVLHPYEGKYVGQVEATGSRMELDAHKPGEQEEI